MNTRTGHKLTYLDNNATTFMSEETIDTINKWFNRGNPSALYASAKQGQKMMAELRAYVTELCDLDAYDIVFTSCASESNTHIIVSTVRAWSRKHAAPAPHIVSTGIEHKSIINCVAELVADGLATATEVDAQVDGTILPADIEAAIKPNTCMVICMAANNETGAINDVARIGGIAHAAGLPLFTDGVQLFGRSPIKPGKYNIDAFSVSAHKFGGPVGVGMLIVSKKWVGEYGLCAHICGSQNSGMRGGTENVPLIAGMYAALRESQVDRRGKNSACRMLRTSLVGMLKQHVPVMSLPEYIALRAAHRPAIDQGTDAWDIKLADSPFARLLSGVAIVTLTPASSLPNTLLLAVIRRGICNSNMRQWLMDRGIIVSIGSACNTGDKKASHVLYSMRVPRELYGGTLRISLGDSSAAGDLRAFMREFIPMISSDCCKKSK